MLRKKLSFCRVSSAGVCVSGEIDQKGKVNGRSAQLGASVVQHDDIAFDGAGAKRHDLAVDPELGAYRLARVDR
jgi:hypothetical protein